ncbi:MAG: hypothetical protein GEV10_22940 [Streptosporangiales bacterium]|nr:hypothetical protein [Streptosporangiales bacterium]
MGLLRMVLAGVVAGALLTAVLAPAGWASAAGPADGAGVRPRGPVVVLGDLRTAEHVAVLVPGMGIDPSHLGAPNQVLGMARALRAEALRVRPDVRVAVVAWADYPAPSGFGVEVARGGPAAEGAHRLDRYLDTLRTRTGAPVSLFCHSYGSVVCGLTPLAGRVSDVVVYGSPGVRHDRASAFGPDVRVWAARADSDWIRFVPHVRVGDLGHGVDPTAPSFGARVLDAAGVPGHGGYFTHGSDTLRSFARIATGDPSAARLAGSRR